jgi:hypothetical protein
MYRTFSGGQRYTFTQRLLSHMLYGLFFMNVFNRGDQIIVLADVGRPEAAGR